MKNPQSRLKCYLTFNGGYQFAEYLLSLKNTKQRRILTKYRLTDHQLALETGRHRQTRLPREECTCSHCSRGEVDTDIHFILHCEKFSTVRDLHYEEIAKKPPNFPMLTSEEKLVVLLGGGTAAPLEAKYVCACPKLRDSQSL